MHKLSMFQKFDLASFIKDKSFMIQGAKYNEKKGCVSLDVVITEDYTDYGDTEVSNIFEKFKVHCINDVKPDDVEKYNVRDKISFKSYSKATVWGDYGSQLSVDGIVERIE